MSKACIGGLGMVLAMGTAMGGGVIVYDITSSVVLSGGAGVVDIVEVELVTPGTVFGPAFSGGEAAPGIYYSVGYFVDVKSPGAQVDSFAVSVSDLFVDAYAMRGGWGATMISGAAWDSGLTLPNGLESTTVGSYAQFFDAGSAGVAFFTNSFGTSIGEDSDSDVFTDPYALEFGLLEGFASSETLIFGSGGSIIDGSQIPEPSAGLLGLAACGLLLRRERKRS